jgi:acyl-CoA reductase-like NAD-dependent aldehyde dehydrogenase
MRLHFGYRRPGHGPRGLFFRQAGASASVPGNTPAIVDSTARSEILARRFDLHSKSFDNGMICASEQS